MKLSCTAILLALFLSSASALADSNSFDLQNMKDAKLGSSSYSFDKSKNGYKIKSNIGEGKDASQNCRTLEYKITPDGLLVTANLRVVEYQRSTYYEPGKAHNTLSVKTLVSNVVNDEFGLTTPVPKYLLSFSGDASIWQVLVDLAVNHPSPNNTYTIYSAPTSRSAAGQLLPAHIADPTAAKGTLDGKPIVLKRYTLTLQKGGADIYTDQDGKMMQADINYMNVRYIRSNFVLGK
jgi:hypothetical protein